MKKRFLLGVSWVKLVIFYGLHLWATPTLAAQTGSSYLTEFAASLSDYVGLKIERLHEIAAETRLAHPSLLEQWGVYQSSAAASYNHFLDTIVLQPELIIKKGLFNLRIISISEMRSQTRWSNYSVGQIFHELSHAEFDHFIEGAQSGPDGELWSLVDNEIVPWIQTNFPALSRREAMIAAWELHGYFRHDVVQTTLDLRDQIILENGVNLYRKTCFLPPSLLQMSIDAKDTHRLFLLGRDRHLKIRDEFLSPPIVYVKGQEVNLRAPARTPFPKRWLDSLWNHYVAFYQPPETLEDILELAESDAHVGALIKPCRDRLRAEIEATRIQGSEIRESLTESTPDERQD